MVQLMFDFIKSIESDYDLYMTKDDTSELLLIMEKAGILPPDNCSDGTCYKYEFNICGNQWEPEDET